MNNAFASRKMRDYELAHSFCFWKPYKHTRKMAKVLSFETIPHFSWKNDKGVKPASGIQPAFCGDFIISTVEKYQIVRSITIRAIHFFEYGKIKLFPFLWSLMVEMLFRQLFGVY